MTTKERIIDEALTLFSKRGYSGVSIKEIAAAAGIKDGSLYKHFTSKREIFDTIVTEAGVLMEGLIERLHISNTPTADMADYFVSLSTEMLVELSKKVFLFYLKDAYAARFRRMLTIEQYHDSEISFMYKKIFTEESIAYQSLIFEQLIKRGAFKPADPQDVAMNFYAPIFLLITRYDNTPEKEAEALELVARHVREFSKNYASH